MTIDVSQYTDLITNEHQTPLFLAVISSLCQASVDQQIALNSMPILYDIDFAVGQQLDTVGLWIGVSRNLSIPLTGVYFSFDDATVGFDSGTWFGPFDPVNGLVALPDDSYRTLLRARIANNQWDGTIPGAYKVLAPVFPGDIPFIQDNGDMTMYVGVIGPVPLNAVTYALLTGGYLDVKPAGVRIAGYITSSIIGTPIFGFDSESATISGFDVGAFATITGGN